MLKKSLGGFIKKNSLPELRAIISFIRKYIEDEEGLRKFVKKRIISIAGATDSYLIGVEDFLFEYGLIRDDIKMLMEESFTGFASAIPEELWAVADFLIKDTIKINSQNQVAFDREGANFTKTEVKILMQESFTGFTRARPKNIHAVAEFFNQRIWLHKS